MIVRTPKRLHLGIIDPIGTFGRRFGSIGVALEDGYEVKITPSDSLRIEANDEDKEVIKNVIEVMNSKFGTGFEYHIEVRKSIPRHVGLGSVTQLSLAVGSAVAKLSHLSIGEEDIAKALGRAKESGAGLYVFKYGGLVIDGGVKEDIPPLIVRHTLPPDWGFILVMPNVKRGLSEREEEEIMKDKFGDEKAAKEISHRILLQLLPALIEKNIKEFGKALSEIQALVGRHFSAFQGGEFRDDIAIIVNFLKEKTYGAGQSSWGPTVYGLIRISEYEPIKASIQEFLEDHGIKARVELGIPRNTGAEIVGENLFLERLIKSVGGSK
ncbi:beta-ribofuranosylaminobenzene 5'-phosphate synthase family protein [Pyrococcus sp. ST04]|uniref:beta-ribofuranosylaminobenzene 5'-phosphate synthase family protein n=1 Tax=Pyrococcus sp. ST04 TaxID=1183377 RepID=UPI0002605E0D|nr:beta-ribofuranosylaminobenzene 5'-phosphate synthase family protein [Pyrococcus sp. ST04]AFK22551.1 hypothetical protein containing GHMP kinase domain [Pyrococcus sp. ST04]